MAGVSQHCPELLREERDHVPKEVLSVALGPSRASRAQAGLGAEGLDQGWSPEGQGQECSWPPARPREAGLPHATGLSELRESDKLH